MCGPKCPDGAPPEACHDLSDVTDGYLAGETSDIEVLAEVLVAAAKGVDEAPTPGSIRAYTEAFRALHHAQRIGRVP